MNKRRKIMTDEQARSVYSAMNALKSSGGRVIVVFQSQDFSSIRVRELSSGSVRVTTENAGHESDSQERYADQSAFAAAYGLIHSASQGLQK